MVKCLKNLLNYIINNYTSRYSKILFVKSPLFYLATKEIQQNTKQDYKKNICYFEFSRSGFPCLQNKRAGISKKFLSFFTLFLYIPWLIIPTTFVNNFFKEKFHKKIFLKFFLFFKGEYGGWMEALDAGDYTSVFVLAQPAKIPRHNFYEFIWLLKTGLPRYVSINHPKIIIF